MSAPMIAVPKTLACAYCGMPVHGLLSVGLTPPVNQDAIPPADFCGIGCLRGWATDQHQAAQRRDKGGN
jgi:hypothetical protein